MQERLERIERRLNLAETAIDMLKRALASLDKRVFRIEARVFSSSFLGSTFGASLVIGAFYAWQKLTQGGP